ncbi:hypothetical protein Tco_1104097 [Tanacetum coccineum]
MLGSICSNLKEAYEPRRRHLLRSDRGKDKKRPIKDTQPSKISSASKESSKGNTLTKTSKFGKSVTAEEPDEEHVHNMSLDAEENIVDKIEQTWFNDLKSAQKDPLTFDELMATPIDFSEFAKNRLKLDKITKENPNGDRCLFDLTKPLPLKGHPGHLTIAVEYFFNNDLEYLKSKDSERKYTTSITKVKAARFSKHDVYSPLKILSVVSVKVNKLHGDGYLEEIAVRRAGRQKYKFKEGDFIHLHLNDIEDMLLLVVQITRVVYEDLSNRKRLMRADELYKFSDGTLMKRCSGIMLDSIDKQLLEMRIIMNLERLVGARELEIDYRLMQRIV